MPQFNETTRPLTEITISRTVLRRCGVVVPLGLLLLINVIGVGIGPSGVRLVIEYKHMGIHHTATEIIFAVALVVFFSIISLTLFLIIKQPTFRLTKVFIF